MANTIYRSQKISTGRAENNSAEGKLEIFVKIWARNKVGSRKLSTYDLFEWVGGLKAQHWIENKESEA